MDQLFNESIGSDGIDLGRYSYNTSKFPNSEKKKGGTPFTMIDTGDFFNRMYIKIRGRKNITVEIGSTTSHLEEMLRNPSYQTTNFFGLTTENETQLKTLLTKFMAEWIVTGIKRG